MASPTFSTITTIVLVPLIAWRIYVRFRRASGRQRLSRYRAPITLTIYGLLITTVTAINLTRPILLLTFAIALIVGACLAAYALMRTQFEPTPKGLFYTPHAPIGLSLAALFVARLVYRLIEVYVIAPALPRDGAEFSGSTLTLATFGLLAGYYAWYTLGLARWRRRVLRAKRRREAGDGDA